MFTNPELLNDYNKVVFPHIIAEIVHAIGRCELPVVLDAPTLYEAGCEKFCRHVLAVTADEGVRLARITARDGISEEQARLRLSAGKTADFYRKNGAYIISNDGNPQIFEDKILTYIKGIMCDDANKAKSA